MTATPNPSPGASGPDSQLLRWYARERVFFFVGLAFAIIFGMEIFFEVGDNALFAIDDTAFLVIGLALIAYVLLGRKDNSLPALTRRVNVATALVGVALVFKLFAAVLEMSHPDDFGDEIPGLLVIVFALGNRFL